MDQLAQVIHTIKTNPNDRRIIMSAWNVADLNKMALPPSVNCIFQKCASSYSLSLCVIDANCIDLMCRAKLSCDGAILRGELGESARHMHIPNFSEMCFNTQLYTRDQIRHEMQPVVTCAFGYGLPSEAREPAARRRWWRRTACSSQMLVVQKMLTFAVSVAELCLVPFCRS